MKSEHPTDEQLQEYALDAGALPGYVRQHVQACESCMAAVSGYRVLSNAIAEQPAPVFDFDLALSVETALAQGEARPGRSLFPYLMGSLVAGAVIMAVVILQTNLTNLFSGLSHFFIYASVGAALAFFIWQVASIIRKYRRQFDKLDKMLPLQPYSALGVL